MTGRACGFKHRSQDVSNGVLVLCRKFALVTQECEIVGIRVYKLVAWTTEATAWMWAYHVGIHRQFDDIALERSSC